MIQNEALSFAKTRRYGVQLSKGTFIDNYSLFKISKHVEP